MATTAYLRVSTGSQDVANQKLAILEYARQKKFPIDDFVEMQISSRKNPHQRGIDSMIEPLAPGDRLIVSELSRLGRSLGQVIHIVDELVKRKIRFTAIKENIHFEGKQDLQTKVMVALFGLFAEVERDLISERTREGLARIIHDLEDTKSLFCYKHVVETVFVRAREAFACLTIARHSVCCYPIFSPSLPCCSSISGRAVPTAEPCC